MEEVVIWGAGRASAKRCEWAVFAGYQVICFVDNDAQKQGKTIQEIPVYPPEILRGNKWTIVAPDLYQKEIEAQLNNISYQGRVLGFEQFRKDTITRKEIHIDLPDMGINNGGEEPVFIFDAYFTGLNWGGVESWSCMAANQLSDIGVKTAVICGKNKKFDECTRNCLHFSHENELKIVKEMAEKIASFLPCVFITQGSIALYAAQIVRSMFPEQIKLIATAHGDEINTYNKLQFWSEQLDGIICISKKIKEEFEEKYEIKKDKLLYRPNPISIPAQNSKRMKNEGVLRIGFAARLRKEQKRVHLLPEIIEECLKRMPDVEFDIAGEGECLELLSSFTADRHLEDKVHILGWRLPAEMADFWSKEDIYLNISDFEGMSLAMLEAMACGTVPVVTDVSGVSDVIEDGKNGFIVPVEGWLEAADKIEIIYHDREMLQKAGNYNRSLIRKKCDASDYAEWLVEMFRF